MTTRKAVLADLEEIFAIYERAIHRMNEHNIPQWDERYPQIEDLREDIIKDELYINLLDGKIASAFALNREYDEEYENGAWKYPDADFRVIHRLCVNPDLQNQGIGNSTVRIIEDILRGQGVEAVRLDVFSLNPFALRMYERLGYHRVGEVDFRKGLFYLYEKSL